MKYKINIKKWFLFIAVLVVFFLPVYAKAEENADTREAFIEIVYEKMAKQEENIDVYYSGSDYKELHEQFLDKILPEDIYTIDRKNTSDDADFMIYNLEKIEIHTRTELFGKAKFTLKLEWKENQEQVRQVNIKIEQILKELDIEKASNYTKVKKIHDYIIAHVSYDSSLTCFTTYDALFKGKATCQGYMLLTYKLLTQAGIDCKCIDGKGISQGVTESHGWNIVKLGEKWYNIDATWDDPVIYQEDGSITEEGKQKFQYDFFLLGSKNFNKRHLMDSKFKTEQFRQQYPISEMDFSVNSYQKWLDKHKEMPIQELEERDIKNESRKQTKKMNLIENTSAKELVNIILIAFTVLYVFRTMKIILYK